MKVARHEKIIELIRQYEIDTQEELAARLNEAGFKVTQATVSRDILEEHTPDVLSDKYSRVLKDAVIAMNIGQNIVVVKTIPGMAMAAAAALDAMKWPEILGCIAGDDTIMCVVKTSEQAPGVVQKLGGILSRGK